MSPQKEERGKKEGQVRLSEPVLSTLPFVHAALGQEGDEEILHLELMIINY